MNQLEKLDLLLRLRNLSVQEWAPQIGTTKQNVDYWHKRKRIGETWIEPIAEYFEVVPDSLRDDALRLVRRPGHVVGNELLMEVVRVLEGYLLKHDLPMKPKQKARAVVLAYDLVLLAGVDHVRGVAPVVEEVIRQQAAG